MQNGFQRLTTSLGALLMCSALTTTAAFAQDNSLGQGDKSIDVTTEGSLVDDTATEEAVKAAMQRDTGWYPKLRIGGSVSMNYNRDVDGVNDGIALTFGVFLKGALDAVYKNFEWQNKLEIEHQQTKTPTIDDFIKTADKIDFQTLVLFRIPKAEWLGPFAKFRLQTSIFPGYYLTDKDVYVRYYHQDTKIDEKGNMHNENGQDVPNLLKQTRLKAQNSVQLSDYFEPLILSEGVGLFINPYTSEMLTIQFKAGVAGQHLFADGAHVSFDDDDDDQYYDVKEIYDTHSFGVEGELELSGVFVDYVNWNVTGGLYYPLLISDDHNLKDEELIHAQIEAKISVKLASWASLDYGLIVKRQPFVTTEWQITNTLLFNVGFDVFH